MDRVDGISLSNKLKAFLTKKLETSTITIKNMKRKRKIVKSYTTTLLSIIISAVLASISLLTIPPVIITVLATVSGVLTAVSIKFNFKNRNFQLKK